MPFWKISFEMCTRIEKLLDYVLSAASCIFKSPLLLYLTEHSFLKLKNQDREHEWPVSSAG